jgi:outer membrane lipoprotein-sorting protein
VLADYRVCRAALVLLLLAGPVAAQEASDTWYAERIISGDTPPIVEHLWSKGPKLRAETVIRGHPIVTLVNGERYMTLDKILNTGVSIQRSPDAIREDAERSRPFGNEGSILQEAGGEKVSTEKVGGRPCELYRLTNNEGRQEVCVSRDQARLPLQFKVWRRKSGKEALTRYLDWTSGLALSDEFFEPDPAVTLEHLSYDDYLRRAVNEQIGPAPPFFRDLLHGAK